MRSERALEEGIKGEAQMGEETVYFCRAEEQ